MHLEAYIRAQSPPMHTVRAFEFAREWIARQPEHRGIVLDAGCGTGRSTVHLARENPRHLVIGVDRSYVRLSKLPHARGGGLTADAFTVGDVPNALLLRADLPAFWRLAADVDMRIARQCLFFPNPYPKGAHLKRRWHGHPSFPILLSLGAEQVDLRSNWPVYVEEFALALRVVAEYGEAGAIAATSGESLARRVLRRASSYARRYVENGALVQTYTPSEGSFVSAFEEKYSCAEIALYRADLRAHKVPLGEGAPS